MTTRREFVLGSALGVGSVLFGGGRFALAAVDQSLNEQMRGLCARLAPLGWRQMLLDVTGGELDIDAADLRAELAKPLTKIDRNYPGFGDFALAGQRGIEPGLPDFSLLYHALAAPSVTADRQGRELGGFPTLAEIDIAENAIYASRFPSLSDLKATAGDAQLAVVTFALNYRNMADSVSGRHAQLCFSRTGIGRLGDLPPHYDAKLRGFVAVDEDKPFNFRVVPRRFAPFIAMRVQGDSGGFGPQDALADDGTRAFWVPLHKVFSGAECLRGLPALRVRFGSGMRNDELAAFHRFLEYQGYRNNFSGEALEEFPFVIRDETIASLSREPQDGVGVVLPRPAPLIQEAMYHGKRLTFPVDGAFTGNPENFQFSSPQILPGAPPSEDPRYVLDAQQSRARPAPQYVSARHRVTGDKVTSLNDRSDMMRLVALGGFDAQQYIDSSGDGWVVADSPELTAAGLGSPVPAFCMVGLPDFLPQVSQRDLMVWWHNDVPAPLRATLWALPPLALSQTRIAANVELPAGFAADDDTVATIVTQPSALERDPAKAPRQSTNGAIVTAKVGLPDGSPGLFDPGWDASMGIVYDGPTKKLHRYLVGHGLGSPFVEDAKLCAALGSYWPGVSPDATREYQPNKVLNGTSYPYPSIVPLTDVEIGMVPDASGKPMSWDGVPGPQLRKVDGRPMVAYRDETFVDYIDLLGTMTAALTARISAEEYKARTLSLAALYWALGIRAGDASDHDNVSQLLLEKAAWAVLSFRQVDAADPGLDEAATSTGTALQGPHCFRIEIYRWGEQHPDTADFRTVLVDVLEDVTAYSDGRIVLLNRAGKWIADTSIPT